ncbi:hypothetical protein FocTR4_00000265 [Fusarium oxysporum f. sp. cubense]|uniref:Uncharacterized protein n=2 Tax=Fusarium oxysporum species complex TaxID=171631 RepID=A0A5C6SYK3_FUSOC|nr:hypothetical protein FocTR4_00000265 [Fusarium oxysporum f. sp. cubense]
MLNVNLLGSNSKTPLVAGIGAFQQLHDDLPLTMALSTLHKQVYDRKLKDANE